MSQLIQGLRAKYDHVVIDTPPVLQLADAGILGSQSDEVLVVARMRRTPRPLVEQAITTLTSYNAQVCGIIATDNPQPRTWLRLQIWLPLWLRIRLHLQPTYQEAEAKPRRVSHLQRCCHHPFEVPLGHAQRPAHPGPRQT